MKQQELSTALQDFSQCQVKAPASSLLQVPTSAFTIKNLLIVKTAKWAKFQSPVANPGNNKCRWRCEAELAEENGYNVLKMNLILLSKDSSLTFKLCGARVKEVKEIICWYILISFETFATNLKTGSWKLLSKKFLHCITVLSEEPLRCPGATLTPDKLVYY